MIWDAIDYLGSTLDKPGRAVRGLLGGRADEGLAAVPFSDSLGLTDPTRAVSGADLLGSAGLSTGSSAADAILGFGAEMALDPTNVVGLGALKGVLRGRKLAGAANAVRADLLAGGAMPAEAAMFTKAVDDSGNPLRLLHGTASAYDDVDFSKIHHHPEFGRGYYTTQDPRFASDFAGNAGAGLSMNAAAWERQSAERAVENWKARLAEADEELAKGWIKPRNHAERRADILARMADDEARVAAAPPTASNVRMQYLDARMPLDMRGGLTEGRANDLFRSIVEQEPPAFSRHDLESPKRFFETQITPRVGRENLPDRLRAMGYDSVAYPDEGGAWVAYSPSQIYRPWLAPPERAVPSYSPHLAALAAYNGGRLAGSE